MGIYLSSPKTEKFSEDGENYRVRFGMSAMQGWRTTMEDSHAALPDSYSSTSFFGVYDGHGDDDFIVLTCDGIWDCLSSQQLVDFIHEQLNTENKLPGVCERVLDRCLAPSMRLQMSNSRDLDLPTANLYRNKIN